MVVATVILGVVTMSVKLPKEERVARTVVPERVAKFILQKEKPKVIKAKPKPKPPVKSIKRIKKKPKSNKPLTKVQKKQSLVAYSL